MERKGGFERIVLCFNLIKETLRFKSATCSWISELYEKLRLFAVF